MLSLTSITIPAVQRAAAQQEGNKGKGSPWPTLPPTEHLPSLHYRLGIRNTKINGILDWISLLNTPHSTSHFSVALTTDSHFCLFRNVLNLKTLVCRNVKWYSHYEKLYGRFSKKLKIELPQDPPIPFLGVYPKELETAF